MDLNIKNHLFVVCGASSGFGRAIAESLATEGAKVIAVARRKEKIDELQSSYPDLVTPLILDITSDGAVAEISNIVGDRQLHGILVNAGGPPAMSVLESKLEDWDNAYKSVLRWKIDLTRELIPKMTAAGYGRVVYIESAAVKQPIENLVLSNSFRLAVVGFVKTLSQEIVSSGVTLNILAPGSHATDAMERIFKKKIELTGISRKDAVQESIKQTGVGFLGDPSDFSTLASWLLSPHSRFITGQTISVAGGTIRGSMG